MSKYWMPLVWATNIINRARRESLISSDQVVQTLLVELSDIRRRLGSVISYDTVCVPLVYTQVSILPIPYHRLHKYLFFFFFINNTYYYYRVWRFRSYFYLFFFSFSFLYNHRLVLPGYLLIVFVFFFFLHSLFVRHNVIISCPWFSVEFEFIKNNF